MLKKGKVKQTIDINIKEQVNTLKDPVGVIIDIALDIREEALLV